MPLFVAPRIFAPRILPRPLWIERFRFMAFDGTGMVPVSEWALPGQQLCAAAASLDLTYPGAVTFHLVSSTRGWFTTASGTGQEWFNFLNCNSIEPWASHFQGYQGL